MHIVVELFVVRFFVFFFAIAAVLTSGYSIVAWLQFLARRLGSRPTLTFAAFIFAVSLALLAAGWWTQ